MISSITHGFLGTASLFLISNAVASNATVPWPIPDWQMAPNSSSFMATPQCQEFKEFATSSKQLLTEGLVVIKDGVIQYEFYDDKYSATQPHVLWSLSKTITGALLGTAVDAGKVTLDQKLSSFYPNANTAPSYTEINLQNLFYLDTGFIWNEYYAGNVGQSPVISMLYGTGHADMATYAASRPMIAEGPGYEWNYSTGTPTITMGVLKKVYGSDYNQMPWKNLFNPLGMKNVSFEQDDAGTFIGGAGVFATPRDLARIGYLYLQGGEWNGTRILSQDWIAKTLSVSPGYLSNGTVIQDITNDGVYGGSIWLNRAVKPGFGRPYPYSPEDMYLGMGHFGQLLIVLPSQNMVIARTGYDAEYNSKVDEFVSQAIACFYDSSYPVGKIIPPPSSANATITQNLETLASGVKKDVIQSAVAQSVCACHYLGGVDVPTCISRSNVPLADEMTDITLEQEKIDGSTSSDEVKGKLSWLPSVLSFQWDKSVESVFNPSTPQFGCTLL